MSNVTIDSKSCALQCAYTRNVTTNKCKDSTVKLSTPSN